MDKIITLEEAEKLTNKLKRKGKRIVLGGGCFDILHQGHVTYLKHAKEEGDMLLVFLESDENVRKLKGEGRPLHTQRKRAEVVAALASVDYVVLLPAMTSDEQYVDATRTLSPQVIAITQGDPKMKEKEKQAGLVDGKVIVVTKTLPQYSTTKLLKNV